MHGILLTTTHLSVLPFSIAKDDKDEGGQSTFVSPDGNVAFAIDIGENVDTEVYWSLRVKKDLSWGAVGLGSPDMPGALYLIIYKHPDGSSVTFSPRTAYGHYEPKFYEDMKYDILESKSGIKGDYMYMTVRCMERCRSWPAKDTTGGVLDVYNTNKAIYAYGPKEGYHSKEQDAPLKYHKGYGVFEIDVGRTHGKSELPSINDSTTNVGSKLLSEDGFKPKPNWMSPVHGVFMVLSIVLLMPVGVVLLRSGGGVKWHALNQVIATVGVFAGFGIGVANSFYYQRVCCLDFNTKAVTDNCDSLAASTILTRSLDSSSLAYCWDNLAWESCITLSLRRPKRLQNTAGFISGLVASFSSWAPSMPSCKSLTHWPSSSHR